MSRPVLRTKRPAATFQKVQVSVNLVKTVKSSHNKRRKAVRTVVTKGGVGIPEVKAALTFIKTVGSVSAAKQALAAAEEIRKIV
jgi:hypothetical protein